MPKARPKLDFHEIMEGMLYHEGTNQVIGSLAFAEIDLKLDVDEIAEIVQVDFGITMPNAPTIATRYNFSARLFLIDNDEEPADVDYEDDDIIATDMYVADFTGDVNAEAGGWLARTQSRQNIGKGGSESRGWITANKDVYFGYDIEQAGSSVPSGMMCYIGVYFYKHKVTDDALLKLLRGR